MRSKLKLRSFKFELKEFEPGLQQSSTVVIMFPSNHCRHYYTWVRESPRTESHLFSKICNRFLFLQAGTTVARGLVHQRNGNAPALPQRHSSNTTPSGSLTNSSIYQVRVRSTIPLEVTSGSKLSTRSLAPLSSIHVGILYITRGRIECDSQSWASTLSSSNHP